MFPANLQVIYGNYATELGSIVPVSIFIKIGKWKRIKVIYIRLKQNYPQNKAQKPQIDQQ